MLAMVFACGAAEAANFRKPFQPNPPPKPMQPNGPAVLPKLIVPERALPGANCKPACSTQCARISCSGLPMSQCLSARQSCRVTCRSRC
jgi:hypothetical protein